MVDTTETNHQNGKEIEKDGDTESIQIDIIILWIQELNNLKSRVSKELDCTIEDTKATEETINLVEKVLVEISSNKEDTPIW